MDPKYLKLAEPVVKEFVKRLLSIEDSKNTEVDEVKKQVEELGKKQNELSQQQKSNDEQVAKVVNDYNNKREKLQKDEEVLHKKVNDNDKLTKELNDKIKKQDKLVKELEIKLEKADQLEEVKKSKAIELQRVIDENVELCKTNKALKDVLKSDGKKLEQRVVSLDKREAKLDKREDKLGKLELELRDKEDRVKKIIRDKKLKGV